MTSPRRAAVAVLLLIASMVSPASAAEYTLPSLFPFRAAIDAPGGRLCRIELTAEVIGSCRADLADLRILTEDGREIPFIIDSPPPRESTAKLSRIVSPNVISADRSRSESGRQVTIFHERYELAVPPLPGDVQGWELALKVGQDEFVSRLDLKAVDSHDRTIALVTDGSAFQLPSTGAARLRFEIPVRDVRTLIVSLESEGTGYLQPVFSVEASRLLPALASSRVDLTIREQRPFDGATELVVDRPRGLVPRRLVISTATDTFHRRITVWDDGPGADPEPLGTGNVLRVAAPNPIEVLEIPLRAPRGDRLRLVIEDHDSPPLEHIGLAAILPRPVLLFAQPEGKATTLYFGGGRAHRPRYDLADLDPQRRLPASGADAELAIAILDPAGSAPVFLAPPENNPDYDISPVLAFAMHPGATLNIDRFEYRRHLQVSPSPEGLSRLELGPADLAVLRTDLADLRIVDDSGRQWAYLRQDRTRRVVSVLEIANHRRDAQKSHYELSVPNGPLAIDRLDITADAPFFDRDFVLRGRMPDGSDRDLARGRLVRRANDPRPFIVSFDVLRVTGLELEVTDGGDAPLVLRRVEARSSAPDLYLAAAAGTYQLLLGDPGATPPVYELERVRSTILAVPAAKVETGPLETNPAYDPAGWFAGHSSTVILWTVLGLAVVVLVALTLRAAGQSPAGPP